MIALKLRNRTAEFPTPGQIAVVAVDAQVRHKKNHNICKVLSAAEEAGAHRMLFRYVVKGRMTEPIAESVIDAAGKGAKEYNKYDADAFPRLDKLLRKREVSTVVLCGYHKYYCVHQTAQSALDHRYQVITAPDLLIGEDLTLTQLKAERLYRTEIRMYKNADEIVRALNEGSLGGSKPRSRAERLENRIWDAIIGASKNPKKALDILKGAQKHLAELEAISFEKAYEIAHFLKRVLSMTPQNPGTSGIRAKVEKPLNRIIYGNGKHCEIRTDEDLGWVH